MASPPTPEEVTTWIDGFIAETFPTLMAIIAIAAYSGFVFMFYRLLARRDILNLDLSKYDQSMGGRIRAFFKTGAWLIQYALAIPILIAFWTVVMAVILTLLADGNDHARNALIATSVVGSVRILSYWTEDLSRDVAKMVQRSSGSFKKQQEWDGQWSKPHGDSDDEYGSDIDADFDGGESSLDIKRPGDVLKPEAPKASVKGLGGFERAQTRTNRSVYPAAQLPRTFSI